MKDLVEYLVKNITGLDGVEIDEQQEGERTNYIVRTSSENIGLIIGKGGKTIKAIRNLLKIRATLDKKLVNISVEPLDA